MSQNKTQNAGSRSAAAAVAEPEVASPYVHDRGAVLYNPLTGAELPKDSEGFRALSRIEQGLPAGVDPSVLAHLRAQRFLIEDALAESRRTHLLYVSLETCTSCNHRCPFCPVSVAPRDKEVMSRELFERIVDEVAEFGGKNVVVSLSNYNEPTFDPLFEDRIRYLFGRGIPVSLLTNASGFTPERAELFESLGRFRDLSELTIFADNLVPHVLRLDGVLRFEPALVARIEAGDLLASGSPEEVEIRACAVDAVEQITAMLRARNAPVHARDLDDWLWRRGAGPAHKARPRHRTRCPYY